MTLTIKGTTGILGVFGYPIEHSLSPLMHNAALATLNLDYCYIPFKVVPEELGAAVRSIKALNIRGINVTIPHKVSVMEYLDEISPEAERVGAVNTISNEDGKLKGYNTDGKGFLRSLREDAGEEPRGKRILLIGAGGAAKGIAVELAGEGAERLIIANRTLEKAEDLSELVNKVTGRSVAIPSPIEGPDFIAALDEAEIVINSTPVGMYPHSDLSPIADAALIKRGVLVCDLIYNPMETVLLRTARMNGARTLNGVGMLAYQGAISFTLWTGLEAPVEVMKETLIRALGG